MKHLLLGAIALGLSVAPLSAQCSSSKGCSAKTSEASVQGCDQKASCDSKTSLTAQKQKAAKEDCCESSKSTVKVAKNPLLTKLASLSKTERKAVIDAMATLSSTCPVGRRMTPSMKTLNQLYASASQKLQAAAKSGNLPKDAQASVEQGLALLGKAAQMNKRVLSDFALCSGTTAGKAGSCEKMAKGGSCEKMAKGEACGGGGCDMGSKASMKDCDGGGCESMAKGVDFAKLTGYTKQLCASWKAYAKTGEELCTEDKEALAKAMAVVKPLGLFNELSKSVQTQRTLVKMAMAKLPCSSKTSCPVDSKNCDAGGQAVGAAFALLSSLPVGAAPAKGTQKAECGSKTECSEAAKSDCSGKTGCCEGKKAIKQ